MKTKKLKRRGPKQALRRGRPRKEQRPEEILAAAFEEFGANGFADTRLDDVARRCGIAKGTIYLYFRDKEGLFRAVVRSLIHPVLGTLEALVAAYSGSAKSCFARCCRGTMPRW